MGITHPSTPLLYPSSPSLLSSSDMDSRLNEPEVSFTTISASSSPMKDLKVIVEAAQQMTSTTGVPPIKIRGEVETAQQTISSTTASTSPMFVDSWSHLATPKRLGILFKSRVGKLGGFYAKDHFLYLFLIHFSITLLIYEVDFMVSRLS